MTRDEMERALRNRDRLRKEWDQVQEQVQALQARKRELRKRIEEWSMEVERLARGGTV